MIEIIPTNTCPPDFAELSRRSQMFAEFADYIQLDIADGVFAPEISWPYRGGQWAELEEMAVREQTLPCTEKLNYETHLMVEEPVRIGELLARAGCKRILPHVEAFKDSQSVAEAFSTWKAAGALEVGLSVRFDTPLETLQQILPECDVVQMMSIATLSRQGAPFENTVIERIRILHTENPDLTIAVDGGISGKNIVKLVKAGATRFGVGSAITKAPDPKVAYEKLKALAESAI